MEDGVNTVLGLTGDEWELLSIVLRNLAIFIGVPGAGIALWLNWRRTKNDTNRLAHQETQLENDRRRLANDTFVKAIEQLGSKELSVRLGAIYALERIAIEEQRYHWPIMETLCAYIRERAPLSQAVAEPTEGIEIGEASETEEAATRTPIDIQTVLTVIGRRPRERQELEKAAQQCLDLRHADLRHADMRGGAFARAQFTRSSLEGAYLMNAHLERANLRLAHLEMAYLDGAHLEKAYLVRAHLVGAHVTGAHLEGANLLGAQLEAADLSEAHLEGAKFSKEPKELGAAWDDDRPPTGNYIVS